MTERPFELILMLCQSNYLLAMEVNVNVTFPTFQWRAVDYYCRYR